LTAGSDIRRSLRALRKRPAFAAGTILTLALVIGASTAIFSAPYGLVFRRLPYDDPGRLVMLWDSNRKTGEEQMFVSDVRTGGEVVSEASARLHFASLLLSALSAVALLLAVVGIYGLLAYHTAQRTHEMGVRLALGATRGRILYLVLKQGTSLAGAGVIAGTAAAAAFARSLASMLYGVAPMEPATFAGTAMFLLMVAFLACYVPARRAATVDPIVALRHE
jgi:predicted lysophospholipase L1 biosynthesis ABC-type transport system permease subunit